MAVLTITNPPSYKLGSTWKFPLRRRNKDTGDPINLTGLAIRAVFRNKFVTGDILTELTESNGGIIRDDVNGLVTLVVEASVSALAPADNWVYFEAEMVAADGDVFQSDTYRFMTEAQVT